jgi:hypothetical protein
MKTSSVLFATLLAAGVSGFASLASALPATPQKGVAIDASQARMVQVCEHGRCYWTGDRWGYGGGRWGYQEDWRRHDRYDRRRDWDQGWRRW